MSTTSGQDQNVIYRLRIEYKLLISKNGVLADKNVVMAEMKKMIEGGHFW